MSYRPLCIISCLIIVSEIVDEHVEGVWRQIIETFRGGILADCSTADSFPLEVQEAEESFDLALVAALEIDVLPYLGDARVPDYIVTQLARVLQQGSQIRQPAEYRPPSPTSPNSNSKRTSFDLERQFGDVQLPEGTTEVGHFLPRERFAYWCFDLLFLVCSDTAKGDLACLVLALYS